MPILDLSDLAQPVDDDAKPDVDDMRLWSVTTILKAIDKGEGLMTWACQQAARCAIDEQATWRGMLEDRGRDETVTWISAARKRSSRDQLRDNELGTAFHMLGEQYALTGERPTAERALEIVWSLGGADFPAGAADAEADQLGVYLDRFSAWLDRFQPTFLAAEFIVYSPLYGYAGQADGIMSLGAQADADPFTAIFDTKTTRKANTSDGKPKTPYYETVLQLAAYRFAEMVAGTVVRRYEYYRRRYYLLSPAEQALAIPTPAVDGALCLMVTPEWCEAFPMRANEQSFEAFLYVLEVARWSYQTSKPTVGAALVAPTQIDEVND